MTSIILSSEDQALLQSLRDGDEAAFETLIDRYHTNLVRLATVFVDDQAIAEEVAQETWVAVLKGLDRFEGRSSLKTWIFSILTNRAKTRGQREGRVIPFSTLGSPTEVSGEPAVDPDRFEAPGSPDAGHWRSDAGPASWDDVPEERMLSVETRELIDRTIKTLPPSQQEVINLRDIGGCSAEEVCNLLGISESNQRVLLHRARSKVRRVLEQYLNQN